jgi:hypothetical protein
MSRTNIFLIAIFAIFGGFLGFLAAENLHSYIQNVCESKETQK